MKESDFNLSSKQLSEEEKNIFFQLLTQRAVNIKNAVWLSTLLRSKRQRNKFYKRLLKTPYILTYTELWFEQHKRDIQVYLTQPGVMFAMSMFGIKDGCLLREAERGVFGDKDCSQAVQSSQLTICFP